MKGNLIDFLSWALFPFKEALQAGGACLRALITFPPAPTALPLYKSNWLAQCKQRLQLINDEKSQATGSGNFLIGSLINVMNDLQKSIIRCAEFLKSRKWRRHMFHVLLPRRLNAKERVRYHFPSHIDHDIHKVDAFIRLFMPLEDQGIVARSSRVASLPRSVVANQRKIISRAELNDLINVIDCRIGRRGTHAKEVKWIALCAIELYMSSYQS